MRKIFVLFVVMFSLASPVMAGGWTPPLVRCPIPEDLLLMNQVDVERYIGDIYRLYEGIYPWGVKITVPRAYGVYTGVTGVERYALLIYNNRRYIYLGYNGKMMTVYDPRYKTVRSLYVIKIDNPIVWDNVSLLPLVIKGGAGCDAGFIVRGVIDL